MFKKEKYNYYVRCVEENLIWKQKLEQLLENIENDDKMIALVYLLADGATEREIAKALGVSKGTVGNLKTRLERLGK